jgi:hypothetical protein
MPGCDATGGRIEAFHAQHVLSLVEARGNPGVPDGWFPTYLPQVRLLRFRNEFIKPWIKRELKNGSISMKSR